MITTHVLDTADGRPASGVSVMLEVRQGSEWTPIARATTDEHGRATTLTDGYTIVPGSYRLTFDTGTYLRDRGIAHPFFPEAIVIFQVLEPAEHVHLPLLLSPYGYCTYRGSRA
jgi:5-hydroxyisourate hydrolase